MQAIATKQKEHTKHKPHKAMLNNPKLPTVVGTRLPISQKAFVIWCPLPTVDSGLAETIHALYYLPESFILMIPRKAVGSEEIPMLVAASPLASRVKFYNGEDSSNGEPSFVADAVISGELYTPRLELPTVIVSQAQDGLEETKQGFTVAPTAEAIASALLKIARES